MNFIAILVTRTQNRDFFKSWNFQKYCVEITRIAISDGTAEAEAEVLTWDLFGWKRKRKRKQLN